MPLRLRSFVWLWLTLSNPCFQYGYLSLIIGHFSTGNERGGRTTMVAAVTANYAHHYGLMMSGALAQPSALTEKIPLGKYTGVYPHFKSY